VKIIELEGETGREVIAGDKRGRTTRGSAELKASYREVICI